MKKQLSFLFLLFVSALSFAQSSLDSLRLVLPVGHTDYIESIVYSPNGKFILSTSADKTAILWDAKTGKLLKIFDQNIAECHSGNFSSDNQNLLFISGNTVKVWNIISGQQIGVINFDDIPEQTKEADKEQSNEDFALQANLRNRTASTNGKKRGKRSSSNYGKKMDPLPGTKEEVINIAGLLNTSNWKVQTKSDKKAGEYEFKKELETKAPGVLHIATHGFAFPDEAKKETKLLDMNQTSTYKVSEDPMVRCGLMLGGSNISWTGNPQKMIEQTGDDGILTAAEVANLDLSNTKLVVLSACETGLGKIEGSEGTFGLKRGFKLAGVEQMIVSLWSVPDKETMELMTLFYSDLTETLNPVTSFEKAQKEMRNRYPTDPEKWAGFVLVR